MASEAIMVCIDNSDLALIKDSSLNRLDAQINTARLLCAAKIQSNPGNIAGILTMAGKGLQILVTPTHDLGKIYSCTQDIENGGEANLATGLQVAKLALQQCLHRNLQRRIVVFTCGPVKDDKETLERVGKKLKKNNVAIDIADFGEGDSEKPVKLETLLASANTNNNISHIVHVPHGKTLLEVLEDSPIFTGHKEDMPMEESKDWLTEAKASEQEETTRSGITKKQVLAGHLQFLVASSLKQAKDCTDILKIVEASEEKPSSSQDGSMLENKSSDTNLSLVEGSSSRQADMIKWLSNEDSIAFLLQLIPGYDPNHPWLTDLITLIKSWAEMQQKKEEELEPNDEDS